MIILPSVVGSASNSNKEFIKVYLSIFVGIKDDEKLLNLLR